MQIKKRNGIYEDLDISKIKKQTQEACEGLNNVSSDELELDCNIQFVNGMDSSAIQGILIRTAISKIDIDRPNWTFVGARLQLNDLYKKVGISFDKIGHNIYAELSLREYITKGVEVGILRPELLRYDLDYLNTLIKKDNDKLFTYLGIKTFIDKYAKRFPMSNNIFELPQHLFMANAMAVNIPETENILAKIEETYNAMSSFELVLATPSLGNARLKDKSCFSCFVGSSSDDLGSLFDGYKEQAFMSKEGGGIGWDYSRVRAKGSSISGHLGVGAGKVPFFRINDAIVNAVDQLGSRKGAKKVYIADWDLDIYDFIDLKKNSGEDRRRTHDLFTCISFDDVFMERVEKDLEFTLFDPYDVPDLCETFGIEFKNRYEYYEGQARLGNIKRFQVIKAKDLWKKFILSYFETGSPDMYFKDTSNNAHKNKHLGIIRSLNLCNEFENPVNEDEIAVCNLGSVNLGRIKSYEHFIRITKLGVRILDNIIDISKYPLEKAEKTHKERRSIGLGVMGEAEYLATHKIKFGTQEHFDELERLYSTFQKASIEASSELAELKGCYPKWEGSEWYKNGIKMRNGYLNCIAPTSSISILVGTTQAIEPVYKRKWFEENLSGLIPVVVPNLSPETWEYYISAYEVNQLDAVKANAIRQKYIDMAISFNIFIDPEKITGKDINDILFLCWKLKLKSTYYLRSKSPETKKEEIVDRSMECTGCQ